MLNKKTIKFVVLTGIALVNLISVCKAAAPAINAPAQNVAVLNISSPFQLPDLKPNEKANPIYLMVTINNNERKKPFYSAPVIPGVSKPVQLEIPATAKDGVKIQFVNVKGDDIQALSFEYAFAGSRLSCLAEKKATVNIVCNVSTKLIDVSGIPATC